MRKDLIEVGLLQNKLPEVIKTVFVFHKAIKNIENNPKAVKEAARKLKTKIEKLMQYLEFGEMYMLQKIVQDTLDEYILFFAYVQNLPKKLTIRQSTLLLVKYNALLRLDIKNLETSIKKIIAFEEEKINWQKEIICIPITSTISAFKNLFDNEDEITEFIVINNNPAEYKKSFADIIKEKYDIANSGEYISKNRNNLPIRINIRRDYKI